MSFWERALEFARQIEVDLPLISATAAIVSMSNVSVHQQLHIEGLRRCGLQGFAWITLECWDVLQVPSCE